MTQLVNCLPVDDERLRGRTEVEKPLSGTATSYHVKESPELHGKYNLQR